MKFTSQRKISKKKQFSIHYTIVYINEQTNQKKILGIYNVNQEIHKLYVMINNY